VGSAVSATTTIAVLTRRRSTSRGPEPGPRRSSDWGPDCFKDANNPASRRNRGSGDDVDSTESSRRITSSWRGAFIVAGDRGERIIGRRDLGCQRPLKGTQEILMTVPAGRVRSLLPAESHSA